VLLIIKASLPLAVFNFSSQMAIASRNWRSSGISSISFLVILILG